MKLRKSLIALAALPLFVVSCDKQDLPYDLDGVVHTFAISVDIVDSTDVKLEPGTTNGNYKVTLSVPEYMGSYKEYFKEAELICVFSSSSADTIYSVVAESGIKELPYEVTIDMPALCQKLGITAPTYGDKMVFTTNIIHKDGTIVPGWTPEMGFNYMNTTFAEVNRTTYKASMPLDTAFYYALDGKTIKFTESLGTDGEASYGALVTLLSEAEVDSAGFTAADYIGLKLTYDWYGYGFNLEYCIYINKNDYSVSAPDQVVGTSDWDWSGYGEEGYFEFYSFSGELDTDNNVLNMVYSGWWTITKSTNFPQYVGSGLDFGTDNYKVEFEIEP